MPPIKFSVKQLLAQSFLPGGGDGTRGKAQPFTFYVCKDTGAVFVSDAEGALLNISDLLLGKEVVRSFPAQGCAGSEGATGPQGEIGKTGPAGRDGVDGRIGASGISGTDGRNGRDGIDGVPGPIGPRGEKGEAGSVTYIGPAEVEAAVQKVRAELLARTAHFKAAVAVALEKNKQRECHPTIHRVVDAVLRKLTIDSRI